MNTVEHTQGTQFEILQPSDPRLIPVLEALVREYEARYGDFEGHDAWGEVHNDMNTQLTTEYGGIFLALLDGGDTVLATGAARRYDAETIEFKKFWTHPECRGQRLSSTLLSKLEEEAQKLGYQKIYLTTGPRQPEADRLYQRNGYTPHFDSEKATPHIYTKALVKGVDGTVLPSRAAEVLEDYGARLKAKKAQARGATTAQ